MITKYVTEAGAGAGTGADVANAYTLAQMVTYINALGALTDYHTFRLCGNFNAVTAAIALTKAASYTTRMYFEGYDSGGTVPAQINMWANAAIKLWDLTGGATWYTFRRLSALNISTATYGWDCGSGQQFVFEDCISSLFPHPFASPSSANAIYIRCAGIGSTGTGATHGFDGAQSAMYFDCYAYENAGAGFGGGGRCSGCIAHRNTGAGIVAFHAERCLSIDNTDHAYQGIGTGALHTRHYCVAVEKGAASKVMYQLDSASSRQQVLYRCASYVGGSNTRLGNGATQDIEAIVLVNNPFTDAYPQQDYRAKHSPGTAQLFGRAGFQWNPALTLKSYLDILPMQQVKDSSPIRIGI